MPNFKVSVAAGLRFGLWESSPILSSSSIPVLSATLDLSGVVEMDLRDSSWDAAVNVGSMEVLDRATPTPVFESILSTAPREVSAADEIYGTGLGVAADNEGGPQEDESASLWHAAGVASSSLSASSMRDHMQIRVSKLGGDGGMVVKVRALPLQVVLNKPFVQALLRTSNHLREHSMGLERQSQLKHSARSGLRKTRPRRC